MESLGYKVAWKVLDAKHFGIPQSRKRVYIVGSLYGDISLDNFPENKKLFSDIQEKGLPPLETKFTQKLLELYSPIELGGKAIKDKRGGENNIHSWDLELKGKLSKQQKELMSVLLRERRKKLWAELKRIVWMDGMPLTLNEIHSFYAFISIKELKYLLDDMVEKKYLRYEHPKDLVTTKNGNKKREYATHVEKGYNIVTGKLSFELNKILGKNCIAPTIVATEASRIGVIDNEKIRRMSERECLRFFGFPEWYESNINHKDLYDLIGNTVVTPVINSVSYRLISTIIN
ncbi:DNA-cytosine methyltransferase (EC 2.1.1.37) [uncultured Gammaproteobacteria bacterium]|nr:DNA-cytosine methyltransferase (EC 2.1.1.37) [uncultured Gammaproteobacteria bacterium]